MDITGKVIEAIDVDSNTVIQINLDSYAHGIYHIRIGTGANSIVKKFIKE